MVTTNGFVVTSELKSCSRTGPAIIKTSDPAMIIQPPLTLFFTDSKDNLTISKDDINKKIIEKLLKNNEINHNNNNYLMI